MSKFNSVEKYLDSYRGVKENIKLAKLEKEGIEALKAQEQAKMSGPGDGMPRAPGVHDTTYAVCQRAMELYDSQIESNQRLISELEIRLRQIEVMITYCGNEDLINILRRHYCDGVKWEALAEELHYSNRHVRRLKKAAIDNICKRCPLNVRPMSG